jgi:adenylosuccinate synthase
MTQTEFHHAKPIYEMLPGWSEDISGAKSVADLPKNARDYVDFLEVRSGTRISAIGVGQDRNATIVINDLIGS